ncbi:HAD family hydrolase [Leptolyngbya sp. AN03gr2]|uniref:HAD family hydrolase n=1 Tax=unclassified Leptolyngbya TaxID=2650499 RepID=UPI003D312D3D
MHLVMFDIDGTLTQSNAIDDAAFLQALTDAFGIVIDPPDWSTFRHVTDAWILDEIYRSHFGYSPTERDIEAFRHHLIARLATARNKAGGIQAIPGAIEAIAALRNHPEFAIAYAGGAWTDSALLKLQSAGLPHHKIPAAFADDAVSREEICHIALRRAQQYYQQSFSIAVYLGDGVWDARTSRNLGYPFIGVAHESDPTPLIAEGAKAVLPDFQDLERLIELLKEVTSC